MTRGRAARLAGSALVLGALGAPFAMAQDEGGLRLTFGVVARVESTTNPGLTSPAEPQSDGASLRLSFGLSDATPQTAISLSAAGTLRSETGDDGAQGLQDPSIRLSWRRTGADSALALSAFLTESDLDTLRQTLIDPDTGEVTDDLLGDGTRRQLGGDVTYTLGEGGPWGLTLTAGATDTTYLGDTTEADNRRTRAGASLRFALDPATDATLGLRQSTYRADGEPRRDTLRLEAGLYRALPAGSGSITLFAEDTEDGTRSGLSLSRTWEMSTAALSVSLGATRGVSGNTGLTGGIDWRQDLPQGTLRADLRRSIAAGEDDTETEITAASLGYSQDLTPLMALSLGLTASESRDSDTGDTTRNAALNATLTRALPQDWALDAGYRHRIREETGEGRATSDTVFMELRRNFEWRP